MSVVIVKRDHAGKYILDYTGTVQSRSETDICLECFFDRDIPADYMDVHAGDRVVEWFFTDRWYNIMEYHDVQGDHLKGWYCNITRPTLIEQTDAGLCVAWDDLALDVFIYPDGHFLLLDEDELAELTLSADDVSQIWAAVAQLRALVNQRATPFETIPKPANL